MIEYHFLLIPELLKLSSSYRGKGNGDDSNALVLPARKKKEKKDKVCAENSHA